MTCGLVHASYSLPEWQAVKLTFFAPCQWWRRKMSAVFSGLTNHIIRNQQTGVFHFFSFSQQEDLLRGREIRRLRYGTDIDFTDYKPPFQKHITLKAQALEAEDN